MNQQQINELIRAWTEDKLPAAEDNEITDRILDFVETDDEEMDVEEFLDLHIHQLAGEELTTRHRKWKMLVASVAAASVVLLVVASTFIFTREKLHHTDRETFALEKSTEGTPAAIDSGLTTTIAEAACGRSAHISKGQEFNGEKKKVSSGVGTIAKTRKNGNATIHREERAVKQEEKTAELILTETLAEINAGLLSMADYAKESLNMTNESLLPVNLISDDNEPNKIETNLINALYEIRTLNIDLNFETENKTTEI